MGRARITSLEDLATCALRVARRAGVGAVTSRAVAEEAGVAVGTVYRHAADLDHLLMAAAARVQAAFVADIERAAPSDRPLRPALRAVVVAVLDRARDEPLLADLLGLPQEPGSPSSGPSVLGWISRRVSAAQTAGEIGPCDADLVAAAAFGAVRGVVAHLLDRAGSEPAGAPAADAVAVLTAVLDGLLPRPHQVATAGGTSGRYSGRGTRNPDYPDPT